MSGDTASSLPVGSSPFPPQAINPWKGLHSYTEQDRGIFFGRDQETEDFIRLVRRDTVSVLFARSGFGKTSLLRAGVVPRLGEEGFLPVFVRVDYEPSAPPPALQIAAAARAAAAAAGIDVEQTDAHPIKSPPYAGGDLEGVKPPGSVESQTTDQQAQAYGPGAEIEPAYLSVMCHELFRRMTELGRSEIGSDLVAAEHGNILDGLYERSFEGLDPRTRLFVEDRPLTASGFRGTVPLAEARREDIPIPELESLVDRRLLRFEDRLGTTHVELSHDRLTDTVKQSRDRRRAEAAREVERKREAELRAKLRRSRRRVWVGAVSVFLLLGAIGFYAYGWIIPYHSYCRNYTKRWGMLHPVGPLSASAVAHRSWTLKLTRPGRFRDVQTAEVIDANGELTGQHPIGTLLGDSEPASTDREKESRYEFVYDALGRVVYEVAWDRFGRMIWGFAYAPHTETPGDHPMPANATFLDWLAGWWTVWTTGDPRPMSANATFLGPDGYPLPQGESRAEFIEITYDAKGFEFKHRFTDREGDPVPGEFDAYGRRMEYDPEGRLVRRTSLDKSGEPMNGAFGNAGQEFKYDPDGNLVEARAFDAKGEATLVKGVYKYEINYDEWGRAKEARFFNLSGERATETDKSGAHRVTWEHDDRGNIRSIKLYDTADKPIVAGEDHFDFAAHEQRKSFDGRNHPETIAYFDQEENPLMGPEGWHGRRMEYDERGFVSATGWFDGEDRPVHLKTSGIHRIEQANDAFGQPFEERFFDAENKRIISLDGGYHLRKNEYDKVGNLTAQTYFGVDDKPVADRTNGAHRLADSSPTVEAFGRFQGPVSQRGRPELASAPALGLVRAADPKQWEGPAISLYQLSHVLRCAKQATNQEIVHFLGRIATNDWIDHQVGRRTNTGALAGSLLALSNTLPSDLARRFLRPALKQRVIREMRGGDPAEPHAKALLTRFGKTFFVEGPPWAKEPIRTGKQALTASVLCKRHNNKLSALDVFIREFDDVLMAGLQGDAGAHVFDGEDLERWALKALLGLGVSGNLGASEDGEKLGPRVPELYLRILFGEEALPERCGFFYICDPIKLMDGDALNVKFMTYPEGDPEVGKVYGVILKLRFFTFVMSVTNSLSPVLNVPDGAGGLTRHRLSYRPNGFILGEKGDRGRIGLRWDQVLSGDNVLVLKMAPTLDQVVRVKSAENQTLMIARDGA